MSLIGFDSSDIGINFRRLLKGEKISRPLVWLYGAVPSFAVQNVGYEPVAAYNDPKKAFDAQLKTITMFGTDSIPRLAVGGASDVTWAFGGEIKWPTGEYDMAPVATRYPVSSEEDVPSLRMPTEMDGAGPMPLYLEMARLQHSHGLPVFPFITSPIEGARSLCGPELLLRWMIKSPDLAHRLLRVSTDYSVAVVERFANLFPPEEVLIYVAAPTASNHMISPKLFEAFVMPYQKELHEKTLDAGIRHIYCHICGEQNQNLPHWQDIPMGDPGIVSFGHEVDLDDAVRLFGQTSVVAGNIEPALIHLGDPEEIYRRCREAVEKGERADRGYILMPGCGIPPNVPPYNLYMLKKAVMDVS